MWLYYGNEDYYVPTQAGKQDATQIFDALAYEEDVKLGFTVTAFPPSEVFIRTIIEDEWADLIGLEVDDEIVAVNGIDVQTMTKQEFITALKSRPLKLRLIPFLEEDELAAFQTQAAAWKLPNEVNGVPIDKFLGAMTPEERRNWETMQKRKFAVSRMKKIANASGAVREMAVERRRKSDYRKALKRLSIQDERRGRLRSSIQEAREQEERNVKEDKKKQMERELERKEKQRRAQEKRLEEEQIEQEKRDEELRREKNQKNKDKIDEEARTADVKQMKVLLHRQRDDFEDQIQALETRLAMLQRNKRKSKERAIEDSREDLLKLLEAQREEFENELGEYEGRLRVAQKVKRLGGSPQDTDALSRLQDALDTEEQQVAKLKSTLKRREDAEKAAISKAMASGKPMDMAILAGGDQAAELRVELHKTQSLLGAEEAVVRAASRRQREAIADVEETEGRTIQKLQKLLGIEVTKSGDIEAHDSELVCMEERQISEMDRLRILLRSEEGVVRGLIRDKNLDIDKAEKAALGNFHDVARAEKAASRGLWRMERQQADRIYAAEQALYDSEQERNGLVEALQQEEEKCREMRKLAVDRKALLTKMEDTMQEATGKTFRKMQQDLTQRELEITQLQASRARLSQQLDDSQRALEEEEDSTRRKAMDSMYVNDGVAASKSAKGVASPKAAGKEKTSRSPMRVFGLFGGSKKKEDSAAPSSRSPPPKNQRVEAAKSPEKNVPRIADNSKALPKTNPGASSSPSAPASADKPAQDEQGKKPNDGKLQVPPKAPSPRAPASQSKSTQDEQSAKKANNDKIQAAPKANQPKVSSPEKVIPPTGPQAPSAPSVGLTIVVEGAGRDGEDTNGRYTQVGVHLDQPKYQLVGGEAVIFFDEKWKINDDASTDEWLYEAPGSGVSGTDFPTGGWKTDLEDAKPVPTVSVQAAPLQKGSTLICAGNDEQDYGEIYENAESSEIIGQVPRGKIVIVSGVPKVVDGFTMVPIQPKGAVQLELFTAVDIKKGTVLIFQPPSGSDNDIDIYEEATSTNVIGLVVKGEKVTVTGAAADVQGVRMVPIAPKGWVDLELFQVAQKPK